MFHRIVLLMVFPALFLAEASAAPPPVRPGLQVEDLGTPVLRRKIGTSFAYRAPKSGEPHLFIALTGANELENDPPYQILDFNLRTGSVRTTMGCEGSGGRGPWLHSNGRIYLPQERPPDLVEYDPDTGKARTIGRMTPNYYHATQCVCEGPDGALYVGLYGRHVCRYDPGTDKIDDFGVMGGAETGYIYTIAADDRYVYCGIAATGNWYLVVYDRQTRTQTPYPDLKGGVTRATAGKIYFGPRHELRDGKPIPLAKPAAVQSQKQANLWPLDAAGEALGLEFDLSDVNPHNWNGGSVTVRWRPKDAGQWTSASFKGLDLVPNAVDALTTTPEGKLMGFGAWYGPVFLMDPKGGKTEYLGPAPCSVQDMLVLKDGAYFCGYPSVFAVYERDKPWTLSPEKAYRAEQNPRRYPAGKWTSHLAEGGDGRIYALGNNDRHSFGGVFLVYDPKTQQHRYIKQQDAEHTMTDMAAMNGGRWIVITARQRRDEHKHVVFVYDTQTQAFARQIVLELPHDGRGGFFPTGPQTYVGLLRLKQSAPDDPKKVTHEFVVYGVDLAQEKVTFQARHPGKAFAGPMEYDQGSRFARGPDGCGWLCIDNVLSRILPDGTVEKVLPLKHGANMVFLGDDLYFYNGGRTFFGGFSQIWRIRGVLSPPAGDKGGKHP